MSHKLVELKNYKVLRAQNASAIAKGEEIQRSTTACAELGHSQKKGSILASNGSLDMVLLVAVAATKF